MKIDFNPINFNRLDKLSNRTRPLKITLTDTKNIFEILRGQSKLRHSPDFKDLRFSSDKTYYYLYYNYNIGTYISINNFIFPCLFYFLLRFY